MDYTKEIFKFNDGIPVKIIIHKSRNELIPKHWHNCVEITYMKKGRMTVWNSGIEREYNTNDIVLINSGEIHSVRPDDKHEQCAITIIIPDSFLVENYLNYENIIFNLSESSSKMHLKEVFDLIYNSTKEAYDEFASLKIKGYLYEILYILFSECKEEKNTQVYYSTQKYIDRMKCITKYIENNYKEQITLESISKEFGLSKEHLSRNFKVYVGITFTKYLETIRIYNAHRDLLNTDYSITDIALEHGFPNIKSFINSFKKIYGETPYKYKHTYQK